MPRSSGSMSSSLEFALRPPDAGQRALDERVRGMTSNERTEWAFQMRRQAFIVVNQAADEAGPMSEVERAIFILRRLYPEFTDEQLAFMRADFERRESAGTWTGFERPTSSA